MNARKAIQVGCALILGLAMYMPAARADIRDQEATLTFSSSVQVSDTVILPAGPYTFRLADMLNYPNNVIQIFDANGNYVTDVLTEVTDIPTGLAIPMRVNDAAYKDFAHANLQFAEARDHYTLVKYFYPGDTEGHKFTYSRQIENEISEEPTVSVTVTPTHHAPSGNFTADNVSN